MGLLPYKVLKFVKCSGFVALTRNHFLVFGIKEKQPRFMMKLSKERDLKSAQMMPKWTFTRTC